MASIITQNIGTAVASITQPAPVTAPAAKDPGQRPVTQEQIQRLSQESARSIASNLRTPDNKRAVQIPKRVESSFASQDEKGIREEIEKKSEETAAEPKTRPSRAVA